MNLNKVGIPTDEPMDRALENNAADGDGCRVLFRNLESELVGRIRGSRFVVGCVAWLTSVPVLEALATCEGVSIIVQKEDFLRPDVNGVSREDLRELYGRLRPMSRRQFPGVLRSMSVGTEYTLAPVRCMGVVQPTRRLAQPRMHNKFIVLCDDERGVGTWVERDRYGDPPQLIPYAVWTGSYNFTKNATRSFENAVVLFDDRVCDAYFSEYQQIAALSEPLDWTSTWVEPEWRIGT